MFRVDYVTVGYKMLILEVHQIPTCIYRNVSGLSSEIRNGLKKCFSKLICCLLYTLSPDMNYSKDDN